MGPVTASPRGLRGNLAGMETGAAAFPRDVKKNAETKTHFTEMLLLLYLQWQNFSAPFLLASVVCPSLCHVGGLYRIGHWRHLTNANERPR